MTVKQMFKLLKRDNGADRNEIALSAGVSRQTLGKMATRNDMKLSTLRKISEDQGFTIVFTNGIDSYEFTEDDEDDLF